MHAIDTDARDRVVTTEAYAPSPVSPTPATWHLRRTEVLTPAGAVVVHHRPGPDPLLLLHGVAGSWSTWTPLLTAAHGVGDRGLVLVDLPGWGSSPAPSGAFDLDDVTLSLVAVLDALGITTVDVVGHSMGAFVGMHLAVVAPRLVRSVALVSGTTVATADAARRPLRGLRTLPSFTLLRAGLSITGEAARPMLRALSRVGLLPLLAAPVFTHVRRLDRSVLDAFVEELRPTRFTDAARTAAGYDLARWRGITCPVTAIAGRDDVFARASDLDALRELVPQVRTVLLDDCGHFAHVEHPDAVARELALA
ncbi:MULTISPECIES: alpha/beta fold hydrolase [unclassified Curtobacterium]|uniref:alpha/beta fold hydrolase n=1 Tax=unclassified Curtobacterium TaxID=257496 RepID=UPI000FB89F92|nr:MULTISPECIES: alpha/beta hydrolase [unclassified Curtobacterium]ROQ05959.1 pimeloyl-ACP methyl ester carboxylesterase [Curtobacterium sp. PhB171]ROQ22894.1 pimeloyl-ACP methyl ester carboxylesterase [Curtobacterium sp. PhB170]ROS34154.1 pimeloyl-ACP methyl ester carboxylesterase [Curtobacterium sp. PhB131]ROS66753.1 pimeloyl-ACP methyl ester carboxylesterase [Curtobacterium sp. PhB141]